jgi:hypothetical protein
VLRVLICADLQQLVNILRAPDVLPEQLVGAVPLLDEALAVVVAVIRAVPVAGVLDLLRGAPAEAVEERVPESGNHETSEWRPRSGTVKWGLSHVFR